MTRSPIAALSVALGLLVASAAWPARAWLLHEHAASAHEAIEGLPPVQRQLLELAWALAANDSRRLCTTANDPAHKLYATVDGEGTCLSFPALTGLGGDHSCTPADLGASLKRGFVLDVLREAETVETRLRQAESSLQHVDAWHQHHLELQIKDPDYLGRAEENGAHFQLPRRGGETLSAYLARVTSSSEPINAIALYVTYHEAALRAVRLAAFGCVPGSVTGTIACPTNERSRNSLFAQAILAEAFALHFLQDAFSAGHVMSPNGTRATRMGTHDHYSEHGVAVRTWRGHEYVAYGDSFMTRLDRQLVASALRSSLVQLADAMLSPLDPATTRPSELASVDACRSQYAPPGLSSTLAEREPTLSLVPQPVLDPPALPQFQEELGVFYVPVLGAAARLGIAGPVRDDWRDLHRFPFVAFGGVGLGGTFEGVTDSGTDGIVSVGLNFMLDGRPPGSSHGIRLGGGVSFHVPYYLIPGDLLLLTAVIPFSFETYLQLARRAAAGGLLGLQRKLSLPVGMKFQFMLGREALIAFMPPPDESDNPATGFDETRAAAFSLTGRPGYFRMALPVFALNAFHASSEKVGLDAVWQLGYDFTYYSRSEQWVGGAARGETHHGLFLAFSYRARRYVWVP